MQNIRIGFLFLVLVFSSITFTPPLVYSNTILEPIPVNISKGTLNPFQKLKTFEELEWEVHLLINEQRQNYKRKSLFYDPKLARMARYYSMKMGRGNFFDHYDRDGNSVVDRAEKFNITNYRGIGENLFFSEGYQNKPSLAVKSWFKSKGHRRNFLKKSWTHTGIGVFVTGKGKTYITQVFIKAD